MAKHHHHYTYQIEVKDSMYKDRVKGTSKATYLIVEEEDENLLEVRIA
jgi:hypothetical protein